MSTATDSGDILNSPPFYTIEGVANFRDLGGYPSSEVQSNQASIVRPKHIFRSAELTYIKPFGAERLEQLGIRKVFDLRADAEVKNFNAPPVDLSSVGISVERIGLAEEWPDAEALARRLDWFKEKPDEAFTDMYTQIVKRFAMPFGTVLRYIKDHPEHGCLVHCTAGKDRSGIFSAILLMLLGVSDENIAHDYSLTAIGLEPFLEILAARFKDKPVFKDHWEGFTKMGSSNADSMLAFMKEFRKVYGDVENYLISEAGLTVEDLYTLKKTLLVSL